MPSTPSNEQIVIGERSYLISELTEFGFTAPLELPNGDTQAHGVLILEETQIPVEFRIRRKVGSESSCSFANFSRSPLV